MSLFWLMLANASLNVAGVDAGQGGVTPDPSGWPRYQGVNAFVKFLEAGDTASANNLVVPLVNEAGGHLKIPLPEAVLSTLSGCEAYGHKYASGDFPLLITRWQCGDAHYTLFLRPSYDGQSGKVQLAQFAPYPNAHLHGRGKREAENPMADRLDEKVAR